MEPWQEAELRERYFEGKAGARCVCCGERILTERCLDLADFGLQGYGCERCAEQNTVYTEDINRR